MSLGNTRKAGILLVRKLYTLMQSLGPLPENVCLNMKLGYYDEGKTSWRKEKFFQLSMEVANNSRFKLCFLKFYIMKF